MADDDELRINTLHRFAKRSPALILHEYSHCEVPAGCGGVVLRWLDPDDGRPASVSTLVDDATATVWLDGVAAASSLTRVRVGARVVAAHLTGNSPDAQPFTVTSAYDAGPRRDLISRGSPRWRVTDREPPADWMSPGFDDTAWREPVAASKRALRRLNRWSASQFQRARDDGQPVFQLEGALWLRVAFTVAEPAP